MALNVRPSSVVRERRSPRTTYYISSSGSSTNTGKSPSSPWDGWGTAYNEFLTKKLNPGDRVLIDGSAIFNTSQIYIDNTLVSRRSRLPIVFSSYKGRATIKINVAGESGIYSYNQAVAIRNLNIVGSGYASSTGGGLFLYASFFNGANIRNFQAINCTIEEFRHGVIFGSEDSQEKYTDFLISNCTFTKLAYDGVNSFGRAKNLHNGLIRHCNFTLIHGDLSSTNGAGNGVVTGNCKNSIIEFCTADNTGANAVQTANLFWFYNSDRCIIRNCSAINQVRVAGTDGGSYGIDINSNDCSIINCFAYNSDGAGILLMNTKNAVVAGNVIVSCDKKDDLGAIAIFGGNADSDDQLSLGSKIYNNTIIYQASVASTGASALIKNYRTDTTADIFNNLFITNKNSVNILETPSTSGINFYQNAYQSTLFKLQWGSNIYATLNAWRAATGKEVLNSSDVGVRLISSGQTLLDLTLEGTAPEQFKLFAPSNLAGVGLDLAGFGATFSVDLFGNAVNQSAPNIGADQSIIQYAAPASSIILSEDCSGTAGSILRSRSPQIGDAWVRHPASNTSTEILITAQGRGRGNHISNTSQVQCWYYSSNSPSGAHYIETDIYVAGNVSSAVGLCSRLNTSGSDTSYVFLYQGGNTPQIFFAKRVAGTATVFFQQNYTIPLGTSQRFRLEVSDSIKRAIINGVEIATSTDNTIASGRLGVRVTTGANIVNGDNSATQFDDLDAGVL